MENDTGRGQSRIKPTDLDDNWSTIMIKFIRNCVLSFIATDSNASGRFDTVEIGSREGRAVQNHSRNSANGSFDVGCW